MTTGIAAFAALTLFLVLGPVAAQAVTLGSPPNGSTTSSNPTFTWSLGTGEEATTIEMSPNPAIGGGGGFADDIERRGDILTASQTSYTVGTASPFFAGTWYWHVSVFDDVPCCDFRWSDTHSFQVPDEAIKLISSDVEYLSCIKEFQLQFEYSDNSRDQFASWSLRLSRKAGGPAAAEYSGIADETDFGNVFESLKRTRKLRFGKKYFARLALTDQAGHVTQSAPVRLRIQRC